MTNNLELFNLFHLFTFIPLVGLGGILWFERMLRHPSQKRTLFLFVSLVFLTLVGIFQVFAATFQEAFPRTSNMQVIITSLLGYFLAFTSLEYSIHCKRIDESFLSADFSRGLKPMFLFLGILTFFLVIAWVYAPAVNTAPQKSSWTYAFQTFFLDNSSKTNAVAAYRVNATFLAVLLTLATLILYYIGGRNIFNLQKGVIRMRSYPFLVTMAVTLVLAYYLIFQNGVEGKPAEEAGAAFTGNTLPLWYFLFVNLVYALRMVEEFFFWSLYNLRSDRNRVEQRQHVLDLLIRRVITSPEGEDKEIVREAVEKGLEKIRSRMVVHEYNITGLVIYRVHGHVLKIDTPDHLFGYCSPLTDSKSFKNLDKDKLNDQILRGSFDVHEIMEATEEILKKDFGKALIRKLIDTQEPVIVDSLPENYKGLQRMIGLHPIFDGVHFMGALVYFKDSFNKLYPAEKEILTDLCENLGTIFALMHGKEIQKERNRLQGEMQSARNIQTSILPKTLELPGFQVHGSMETATEVGGDVYDLIPHKFGNYIAVGDVAGHGLPAGMMAALQMAAFQGALEASKVLDKEIRVDALYDAVNRVLCTINRDRIGSDKFMTANYFCEKNGTLYHAGTNTPALMYRKATNDVIEVEGLTDRTAFLGISEMVDSSSSYGQFKMEPGDLLMLYSDGLIEAKDHYDKQFGMDPVKTLLINYADKPLEELDKEVRHQVAEFAKSGDLKKNGGHFSDDVTIVYLRKV